MTKLLTKLTEKKNKENKEKKRITMDAVLDGTKKAFIGATAVGLLGVMVHGYGVAESGIQRDASQDALTQHLTVNGYHAANYENKAAQVIKLIAEYKAGIISYDELATRAKDENLSELDVDLFVKHNLDNEQYQEYLALKKDTLNKQDKLEGHGKGALISVTTALVMASGVIATGAAINFKKKRAEKKAKQKEERKIRQEKLKDVITAEDIDD